MSRNISNFPKKGAIKFNSIYTCICKGNQQKVQPCYKVKVSSLPVNIEQQKEICT